MATQTRYAASVVSASNYVDGANTYSDDNAYATYISAVRRGTGNLTLGIAAFAIPTGSTINSVIAYHVRMWSSSAAANISAATFRLLYGGFLRGNILTESTYPSTETVASTSGGSSFTVAELNSGNLQAYFETTRGNNTVSTSHYIEVVYVIVDYTAPVTELTCASRTTTRSTIGAMSDFELDLPFIAGRLLELYYAKQELKRNLVTKGVTLVGDETLEELINLILTIHYHVYYPGTALFLATDDYYWGGLVRYDVAGWPTPTLRYDTGAVDHLLLDNLYAGYYMGNLYVGNNSLKRVEPQTGVEVANYTLPANSMSPFEIDEDAGLLMCYYYWNAIRTCSLNPFGTVVTHPSYYWQGNFQGARGVQFGWDASYFYVIGNNTIQKIQRSDGTIVAVNSTYGFFGPTLVVNTCYKFGSYVFLGFEESTDVWKVVKLNASDMSYVGISPQIPISEPGYSRITRMKAYGSYLYVLGVALSNAIQVITISTMALTGGTCWNFDSYADMVIDPAGVYGYACNGYASTDPRFYRITLATRAYSLFSPVPYHGVGTWRMALHWFPTQYNSGISVYAAGGAYGTGGLLLYDGDPATPLKLLDTSVEAEYKPTWTGLGETGFWGNWLYVLDDSRIHKVHPALLEVRESSAQISGSIYGSFIDEANGVFWIGRTSYYDRVSLSSLGISTYGPYQINGYSATFYNPYSDGTYLVANTQYGIIILDVATMTKLAELLSYHTGYRNSQAKVAVAGGYVYAMLDLGVSPAYEYRILKFNAYDLSYVGQSAVISTSADFFTFRLVIYGNHVYALTTDASFVPIRRYNLSDLAAAGTGGSDSGWTDIAFDGTYLYAINLSAGSAITTHRLWKLPISTMSGSVYASGTSQWGATSMTLHDFE